MRIWLIFYLAAGVVSAIAPTWDVRCSKETDPIPCRVTEEHDVAGKENRNDSVSVLLRPHDLRVEPRVKANPVDGGHWLETVLSWETPSQPLQNAKRVTGFQLAIAPLSGAKLNTRYFLFRIPDTVVFTNQFQRFAFTSRGLLQFGQSYEIGVWSLPMPSSIVSDLSLKKVVRMPRDPDSQFELLAPIDCRSKSHEDAARWVSGFRRLDLFVLRRELNVSFVAAPPQYCFQQYKLTLTNTQFEETTVIINDRQLVTDRIDNATVRYGEHIFSNLKPGEKYRVSVVAVERRADDGRCVCPVRALITDDLRTGNAICSCTSAESDQLYFEYYEPTTAPISSWIPIASNMTAQGSSESMATGLLFMSMILLIAILVVGVSMCAIVAYFNHLRLKDRAVRIRFIADRTPYKDDRGVEATQPFVPKKRSVTIVYAHDSLEHELMVEALARFLNEQLKCSVMLDAWCENELARDKTGWIHRSVDVADYIVFVHSIGARLRYDAAVYKEVAVERTAAGPLDDIFLAHAHYALQARDRIAGERPSPSLVHVRCECTSDANVLSPAMSETVYELPRDATSFVLRMEGAPTDWSSSRQWHAVQLGIGAMVRKSRDEPDWFERTHCRLAADRTVPLIDLESLSNVVDDAESGWRSVEEGAATAASTIDDDCVLITTREDPFGNDKRDRLHDSGLAISVDRSVCAV